MTIEVKLPAMGDTVEEAEILTWFKSEGEWVEEDEALLEVATDKIDTEVPSPATGTLAKILVRPGDAVAVGTVIAEIERG